MKPSPTTASDLINEIVDRHKEIEDTILIGEKITMIHEASFPYNHLRELVTNEYMLEDELALITSIGSSWRRDIEEYDGTMGQSEAHRANLDELESHIKDALNDLFEQRDIDDEGELA